MPLRPGTKLGTYEIVAPLGAGGMGEVYRAHDSRLNRDVAVKVLPAGMAQDPTRRARLEREAQMLAALNHPNIAAVYGIEGSALVMELVEGQPLAGPLPVAEAVAIAKQIAEALEVAHDKGIIHRDLKPSNILVTADGQVKVLDFGLAKVLEDAPEIDSNSPTLSMAATQLGVILGTAAYMSPEQAKGKRADRRSDIWSFGVVLLELITGRRAFEGETASEVMAAVMLRDPAIPPGLPPHIERLLRRCLTRDPRQRLQAIGEARILLDAPAEVSAPTVQVVKRASSVPWIIAAAMLGVAAIALWAPWRTSKPPSVRRTLIELDDIPIKVVTAPMLPALAIAPDASSFVFVGSKPGNGMLYLRRMDQLKPAALAGTEGASMPFYSPDGRSLAFFANGKLRRLPLEGGVVATICDAPEAMGGSWADDGSIVFAPARTSALMRVPSTGGTPEPLTVLGAGEGAHRWPQVLPGGKAVLYNAGLAMRFEQSDLMVRVIATGETKLVYKGAYFGRYLQTGDGAGWLAFIREGNMFAAPFNLKRLETTGPATPVLDGVTGQATSGAMMLALSNDGTLLYHSGDRPVRDETPGAGIEVSNLAWMDSKGKLDMLRNETKFYWNLQMSPDGRSLAAGVIGPAGPDLWVFQVDRGSGSQVTHGGSVGTNFAWTPDGRHLTYSDEKALSWISADGSGQTQQLLRGESLTLLGWHPDGKLLAYREHNGIGTSIMLLPVDADGRAGRPYRFLESKYWFFDAVFSPDGRWLAYQSNESGRSEIYVTSFPGGVGKTLISVDGGFQPRWSRTGNELFYLTPPPHLIMNVVFKAGGDSFLADRPQPWTASQPPELIRFDPQPDGKRMVILRQIGVPSDSKLDRLVLVENFFDELKHKQ